MSRRGNSRGRNGPNSQVQRIDRLDPFNQMRQMMRGFGGMNNDDFFGGMMKPFGSDPFEDMFSFSDIHKNAHQKGKDGSYVCQTFVSSSKMGPDGKMHREDYFENNVGQHRAGNTISQKHQAYKNNKGVNRIAEERMLNDRGRKIVRQKRGNDIEQTNHYYNIDQQEAHHFDNDWKRVDNDMGFIQNHQKYMKSLGNGNHYGNQIQYNPSAYQRRDSRKQPRLQNDYNRRR